MIKVIVCGACGKMGIKIVSLVALDKEMELVGAVEKEDHPAFKETALMPPSFLGEEAILTDNLETIIPKADVIIEFTSPKATLKHLEIAAGYKIPMVIGTTGLVDFINKQIPREKQASLIEALTFPDFPCVMAPNMSPGVNLLFELVRKVAKVLPGYDVEIIEAHHNQKKDAPSGTAGKIVEIVMATNPERNLPYYGRKGMVVPRKAEEIGIHAVRAGDIVGEHTVIFAGPGERIELIHRAHSRDVFAHGAIKAAKWIVGKPAGLYDMQDVLGINEGIAE